MKFWQPIGTAPMWIAEMEPPKVGEHVVRAVTLGPEYDWGWALVYWDQDEDCATLWARVPRPGDDDAPPI